jgi:hypothetical protein
MHVEYKYAQCFYDIDVYIHLFLKKFVTSLIMGSWYIQFPLQRQKKLRKMIEVLTHLTYIRELSSLNLCRKIKTPEALRGFIQFLR